jgi:predicted DCC family thiol-disulfide oxidoreductase YuxK
MPDLSVADVDQEPRQGRVAKSPYRVLYDGQCEICQGCVSWLKTLDLENRTTCLPISAEVLASVDSRLRMDDCLRQLHVVTPEGAILVGWDAVAGLARLFPSTWLVGAAGQRFPFRNAGRLLYGFVARNRYSLSKCRGGACRVVKPEAVRRQARFGAQDLQQLMPFNRKLLWVQSGFTRRGPGTATSRPAPGEVLGQHQQLRGRACVPVLSAPW